MDSAEIFPIARIYNDFDEKFGVPRQSGLAPSVRSVVVFEKPYRSREALRGIDGYSHLWLIWHFSECDGKAWSPTVRPPRLGGNRRIGIFATRSPFRPNRLGLSSVKLEGVEHTADKGDVLIVSGADLMNGTPIVDVKPYVAYSDSHPEAVSGFADDFSDYSLSVSCPDELISKLCESKRSGLIEMLRCDPRPSYQNDPDRVYAVVYAGFEVKFTVSEKELTVTDIKKK
ncbi:MAG: tRNA (N6-threonylcarbamoyladenosine(37)-N6)-methyltransferase TrmO [Acutalibacteraceae bacterium]